MAVVGGWVVVIWDGDDGNGVVNDGPANDGQEINGVISDDAVSSKCNLLHEVVVRIACMSNAGWEGIDFLLRGS